MARQNRREPGRRPRFLMFSRETARVTDATRLALDTARRVCYNTGMTTTRSTKIREINVDGEYVGYAIRRSGPDHNPWVGNWNTYLESGHDEHDDEHVSESTDFDTARAEFIEWYEYNVNTRG